VKGPEVASSTEQRDNPRSQSVRLRAAEKVKGTQR
jgi:16S rRNA C1402 N4-methylase RsmH